MSLLKTVLIVGVLGYGAVLALMYLFQRSLMYFPDTTRHAPAAAGLPQAEEVTLTSADGERLLAWHVPPRGPKPVVLYFQGNAGALDLRAERFRWLLADGTGLLALNYRGYGGSSGKPSEDGLIRDALAAYDFAAARYAQKRIVLWGESLGTAVAVALAAERQVGGVMLDAPFSSAADVGASAYPFVPVRWFMRDPFRSDLRIARVSAPLLVLHGERDRVIPIRFGEKLFALAREPKRMVRFPAGEHSDLDSHGAPQAVKDFLAGLP
ncbi:MAG: alpha/beta hydrolase [Rhizobiales bacterium]|nr:alpha/beta hydrolase [Hyphomicrobiales bacterium]